MIGRQREKKILFPDSVYTRPGQENSEKSSKKIQKIKKPLSAFFLAKTGSDRPRNREKNFSPNSIHTWPGQESSKKNSKKIQKIKKPHSSIIFSQNGMRKAEKGWKFYSFPTRARKFQKKIGKKSKN